MPYNTFSFVSRRNQRLKSMKWNHFQQPETFWQSISIVFMIRIILYIHLLKSLLHYTRHWFHYQSITLLNQSNNKRSHCLQVDYDYNWYLQYLIFNVEYSIFNMFNFLQFLATKIFGNFTPSKTAVRQVSKTSKITKNTKSKTSKTGKTEEKNNRIPYKNWVRQVKS